MSQEEKKTTSMNPKLAELIKQVSETLKLDNAAETTEKLLALREESERMGKELPPKNNKGKRLEKIGEGCLVSAVIAAIVTEIISLISAAPAMGTIGVAIAGGIASVSGPVLSLVTALPIIGLGVVGFVAFVTGAIITEKDQKLQKDHTDEKRAVIEATIDEAVAKIAEAKPQEAVKSPRFLKRVRDFFNSASALAEFERLEAEVKNLDVQPAVKKEGPAAQTG